MTIDYASNSIIPARPTATLITPESSRGWSGASTWCMATRRSVQAVDSGHQIAVILPVCFNHRILFFRLLTYLLDDLSEMPQSRSLRPYYMHSEILRYNPVSHVARTSNVSYRVSKLLVQAIKTTRSYVVLEAKIIAWRCLISGFDHICLYHDRKYNESARFITVAKIAAEPLTNSLWKEKKPTVYLTACYSGRRCQMVLWPG